MIKREFKMTIEIDEKKLKKNYPNFDINYSSVDEFIDSFVEGASSDYFQKLGYRIKIEKEVLK